MKKLKSYTLLTIVALTPVFLIGCDGSGSATKDDTDPALTQAVVRGLDLAEITNNPTGTPGFPFTLSTGETIDFVPDGAPGPFVAQVPLGTFRAENSGFVRQLNGPTGSLYFPVTENSFKLFYGTNSSPTPSTVSTQTEAFMEYSFEHRYTRAGDFVPRMNIIYNSSSAPGSLQYVLTNGGIVTNRNKVVIDAISSIGIAAVDYPNVGPAARRFRSIDLTGITSTNADLAGANPIITGTYTLTDTWQGVLLKEGEGPVTLDHVDINGSHAGDITFAEIDTGTFTIHLEALTQTP